MNRDLGIYGSPKRKKKEEGSGMTFRETFCILATLLVVIYSAFYIFNLDSKKSQNKELEKNGGSQVAAVAPVTPIATHPVAVPEHRTTSSGVVETTVTLSVISSPYTWQYEIKDVQTSDSVSVTIMADFTSQINKNMEKPLMQNYGGNWFHIVFVSEFNKVVKEYVKDNLTAHDLQYAIREKGVEHHFIEMGNNIIKAFSEKSLLPVEIKNIRIVEVKIL